MFCCATKFSGNDDKKYSVPTTFAEHCHLQFLNVLTRPD